MAKAAKKTVRAKAARRPAILPAILPAKLAAKKAVAKKPGPKAKRAAVAKVYLTVKQRDRLLAAAIKTLEIDKYSAFTLARVAARAKLDVKLVKASFPSKLHLLATTLENNLEQSSDAAEAMILDEIDFNASTAKGLSQMVLGQLSRHLSGGWLRLFVNMDIAESEPDHADIWRIVEYRAAERGSRIVREMQRRRYIDDTLDPVWVQFFWNALMDGIAVRARALPEGSSLDQVAEGITPILLRGFAPKRA